MHGCLDGSTLTVEIGINPLVKLVDTRSEFFRIEIKGSFVGGDKVIKCRVKHANNFGRLVIHDGVEFLIPHERDCKSNIKNDCQPDETKVRKRRETDFPP